ncbi:hypothetical protein FE394_00460 [Xenorhabdus sp. Reich]|uniref:Uncharacterized protein n=1 Tax=Xenorhabdus littoralis TaxID=2582835 RepID=A0ABU4SGC6_9GAMM|nr:hypothetical protein [Xenorhabdus sp. Reich]MDX7997705.1 hypothetical protein [Xenorhabdus sp. Reich]
MHYLGIKIVINNVNKKLMSLCGRSCWLSIIYSGLPLDIPLSTSLASVKRKTRLILPASLEAVFLSSIIKEFCQRTDRHGENEQRNEQGIQVAL